VSDTAENDAGCHPMAARSEGQTIPARAAIAALTDTMGNPPVPGRGLIPYQDETCTQSA
jgi:hypothetical protein